MNSPTFIEWVREAYEKQAQITMACPESKSPLDQLGRKTDFKNKQALVHLEAHFDKGLPLGAVPKSLGLLCIDFDFKKDLPPAEWPSPQALIDELAERRIKHFVEPSRTPGRKHIWVYVSRDFAKPKFINVTHQGVKYEALWNSKHVIIWNHEEFIYGAYHAEGTEYLTNAAFNALFHIAANQEDGTAGTAYEGGGAGEVDGKPVYQTGNACVVQDELIQALLANCRDQSLIVENGEWLKVENPCDMSDNMTCRLSFNKDTGAAMDFKSELRYSPIELAKALGLTIHKRKGRPKNEAPEGQIEVSGKTLTGLRECLADMGIQMRYNTRSKQIEYRRGDNPWSSFDKPSKSALREYIAEHYVFQDNRSQYRLLRWGRDLFNDLCYAHVHEYRVDPFIEYLEALPGWDGEERIDTLLIDYMAALDNAVSRWGGRFMFVGAIQRAYEPGCQLDEALVLVGKPGLGKTSIIKHSVPDMVFYTNQLRLNDKPERRIENTLGVAIAEISEMQGSTKSEADDTIDFMSTTHDKTRLAFREDSERMPRLYVIVGTTNKRDSLPNHPGMARRFVPVEVWEELNIDMLVEERDQLWAEALHKYKHENTRANVPRDLYQEAQAKAESHRNRDEIEEILIDMELNIETNYSLAQIKADSDGKLDKFSGKRMGRALRAIGWEYKQITVPGLGQRRRWVFIN